MENVKLSEIARETGYSAERIRQLFDAGEIPGSRTRKPHKMRRCQDCPELWQWMAWARANKWKHDTPRVPRSVVIARMSVERMANCGDQLLHAQQHIARSDWRDWLRSHFPELTYKNVKRCMLLSRRRASAKPVTEKDALYHHHRFFGLSHVQAKTLAAWRA